MPLPTTVDTVYSAWAALLGGMYGVVFVVSFSSALIALAIHHSQAIRKALYALQFLAVMLVSWGIGLIQWWQPHGDPISLRLIQSNIPMEQKFNPELGLERLYEQFYVGATSCFGHTRPTRCDDIS